MNNKNTGNSSGTSDDKNHATDSSDFVTSEQDLELEDLTFYEETFSDLHQDTKANHTDRASDKDVTSSKQKKHSSSSKTSPKNTGSKKNTSHRKKRRKKFHLSVPIVLLIIILILLAISAIKLLIWNKGEKVDTSDNATSTEFDTESMDSIVPLDSTDPNAVLSNDDDELNILFLGNAPLSDDADSSDSMVNIIKSETGANVYNCSIADSYMSNLNETYSKDYPMDAFSFYDLTSLFTTGNTDAYNMAVNDMDSVPEDATAAVDTLQSIDYDKLDVICIDYDALDYLAQRTPYNDDDSSKVTTYAGALEAGIQLIQNAYPNVRIIVMSPTYADYVDSDGNYVSSSASDTAEYSLYIYVIHEEDTCYNNDVSFVDNFYGTIYEEISDQYLTDNLHLNVAGRQLMADRFIYALNRFGDYDFSAYESTGTEDSSS